MYVRNALTGLYYRLTMPTGVSRIAAYVADPSSSDIPGVTNPLLPSIVSLNLTRARLAEATPTVERPYGYDAVAAVNNYQAPEYNFWKFQLVYKYFCYKTE